MQTIVIIGGGAGGLELATRLGDRLGRRGRANIVLIDRAPTHFWKPLLHAVAAGKLDPQVYHVEYSAQATNHHFQFICGEVTSIDRHSRTVEVNAYCHDDGAEVLPKRHIRYDKLVLAFGAVTNFFNVEGAAEHSLTLDTVRQAEYFRRRFLTSCMQASSRRQNSEENNAAVNIVIVGGGATGIELAAELTHTVRTLAKYNIHSLDPNFGIRIRILERGDRLLPQLNADVSKSAAKQLQALGIEVCTGTAVVRVDADAVHDSAGHRYDSDITVWAAGVEGPELNTRLGLAVNRLKQVLVKPSLQTADDPDVYAIGDCSSYVCPTKGTAVPPRAQVAHQQALFLADALSQRDATTSPQFIYRDYGSLVSLGPFGAVGVLIGTLSRRELLVVGPVARVLYGLMYKKHVLSLHGFVHMIAQTLAHWIRAKVTPPVKLH